MLERKNWRPGLEAICRGYFFDFDEPLPRPMTAPATVPATEPATEATPEATPEAVVATLDATLDAVSATRLASRDAVDGLSFDLPAFAVAGFGLAAALDADDLAADAAAPAFLPAEAALDDALFFAAVALSVTDFFAELAACFVEVATLLALAFASDAVLEAVALASAALLAVFALASEADLAAVPETTAALVFGVLTAAGLLDFGAGFAAAALVDDAELALPLDDFAGVAASFDRAAIAGPAPALAWVALEDFDVDFGVAMDFPSDSMIAAQYNAFKHGKFQKCSVSSAQPAYSAGEKLGRQWKRD